MDPLEQGETNACHKAHTTDSFCATPNGTTVDDRPSAATPPSQNGNVSSRESQGSSPHRDWDHAWHQHVWTAKILPDRSTPAHALARAEAASWAQLTPLIAATLGPLAVLMGIPNVTQRWHGQLLDPPVLAMGASNFVTLPDPGVNLALAGVEVFCEIAGNFMLILRFSNFHTRITTWTSYGFWIAKLAVGIANYIQFGIAHPQTDFIIYLQGFWVPNLNDVGGVIDIRSAFAVCVLLSSFSLL